MNQNFSHRPYVLFIPRWYPNPDDPQLGVFIRKHAQAVSGFIPVGLIYPYPVKNQINKFVIEENKQATFHEIRVYYQHKNDGMLHRYTNFVNYFKAFFRGYHHLCSLYGRPQLIHVHVMLRPALAALILLLFNRLPFIISEHWTGYINGAYLQKKPIIRFITRLVIRQSAAITVVSPGLRDAMLKNGLYHPNYQVIPNVVEDNPGIQPSYQPVESGRIIMLSVADLVDRHKNISSVIRILNKLGAHQKDFEYHIIGTGKDEEKLKNISDESENLKGRVIFHGRLPNDEVLSFISQCSFLVVNSNYETFSVVAAEALVAGKPVIATRCGGPELFIDDTNGILIPPGDNQALEDALTTMMSTYTAYNPQLLHDQVLGKFGPEVSGRRFYTLYQKILNRKPTEV